jgi:hypothetical protein
MPASTTRKPRGRIRRRRDGNDRLAWTPGCRGTDRLRSSGEARSSLIPLWGANMGTDRLHVSWRQGGQPWTKLPPSAHYLA